MKPQIEQLESRCTPSTTLVGHAPEAPGFAVVTYNEHLTASAPVMLASQPADNYHMEFNRHTNLLTVVWDTGGVVHIATVRDGLVLTNQVLTLPPDLSAAPVIGRAELPPSFLALLLPMPADVDAAFVDGAWIEVECNWFGDMFDDPITTDTFFELEVGTETGVLVVHENGVADLFRIDPNLWGTP